MRNLFGPDLLVDLMQDTYARVSGKGGLVLSGGLRLVFEEAPGEDEDDWEALAQSFEAPGVTWRQVGSDAGMASHWQRCAT